MQTVAKVVVGILPLLFVGGVWVLIQKGTRLLFGQVEFEPKEELFGIGIGFRAIVLGLAVGIA